MTKSLSELEKQLAGYEQMLHERSCEKLEDQIKYYELKKQLAAVEKELQEYKEALEWLSSYFYFVVPSENGSYQIGRLRGKDLEAPSVSQGKTSLLAIQAAMKFKRKGE